MAQDAVQDSCRLYEQRIKTFGGLDVALLGVGRSGNIAANEPGSGIQSMTRIILIGNTSREEMENSEQTKETIPPCSLTMGIATLLSAKSIYLTAWGEEKAEIMQKVVENSITDTLPASFLQTHPNAHVVIDLGAAHHLTRIEHPWLVTSCQWSDKLVRSALVWLCQKLGKPILKLTNKDYNENGLSELLALYGSAYNANIKISMICSILLPDGQVVSRMPMIPIARSVQLHSLRRLSYSLHTQTMMLSLWEELSADWYSRTMMCM